MKISELEPLVPEGSTVMLYFPPGCGENGIKFGCEITSSAFGETVTVSRFDISLNVAIQDAVIELYKHQYKGVKTNG